ncbi:hypothetical protein [Glycomyces tenuis]|uniref:hypothetical protein n=1 Tax=Glycomyces tenuis TaxID=58116 RepID=UPI00042813BE|nr:hypothetical protein [Glycomyces tenuis]
MYQRVSNWARPRRWSILGEAVLAALLALVSWPIIASDGETEGVELVTAYLEALREGDVEEAKSYIGSSQYPDADESLLTEEALSSDWEIESVEQRSSYQWYVHAVIGSGGRTAETVFHLEGTEDELRIANPYVYLVVNQGPLQTLELNGRWHSPRGLEENGTAQVALFPGSYDLFEDVPGFSGEHAVSFLAMPEDQPIQLARVAGEAIAGNTELEEQLNADLAAWIDFCAQSEEAAPEGCPFSAQSYYSTDMVDDGLHEFEEVQDLAWAVDAYPHLRIGSDLALDTVAPGWMTLSGSGVVEFEGTTASLNGRCKIVMSSVEVTLLAGGQFEFASLEGLTSTCARGLT